MKTKNLTKTINKNLFKPTKAEKHKLFKQFTKIEKKAKELNTLLNQFVSQPLALKVGLKGNLFFDTYQKGDVTTVEFKCKVSVKGR